MNEKEDERGWREKDKERNFEGVWAGVNFINILRTNFSYERRFGSFFSTYVRTYVQKKAAEKTFVQKTRAKNVDEIDTWR